jgi:hypothetical protein
MKHSRMVMNDEYGEMWEEAFMVYFKVIYSDI